MSVRLLCQDSPETLVLRAEVLQQRPGAVLLSQHPFYPGGGGQLPDRGELRTTNGKIPVLGFEEVGGQLWLKVPQDAPVFAEAECAVDAAFRQTMRELHTDLHVLNALVYRDFSGALVTGVQMNDDASARIDFDLPGADNDRIRRLEAEVNDVIRQDLAVHVRYASLRDASQESGLLRSRSVAPPPTSDGLIRIVEIAGLDRQACGGTHLRSTGESRRVRILKIENKGKSNRRVRIGLEV